MSIFPEFPFQIFKFESVPKDYWSKVKHQRQFMDDIGKKLGIKNYSDWYSISSQTIKEFGGTGNIIFLN